MNEQWEEGYQAYLNGDGLESNPYYGEGEFSEKFTDWQIGYECAEADNE